MLKKINAILAFITALAAALHIIFMGMLLCGFIEYKSFFNPIGRVLLGCFTIHIVLSLIIMFFNTSSGLKYPKLNKSIIEQRIAAILMLLFIHFHMNNYFSDNSVVAPTVVGYISEIIFIIVIMCHFSPSVDKALTSLGIYNKPLVIVIKVIAIILFIFALAAVSKYFIGALV